MSVRALTPADSDWRLGDKAVDWSRDFDERDRKAKYVTKQWMTRSQNLSEVVPKFERAAEFPLRNSYSSGEPVLYDEELTKGVYIEEPKVATRILQSTTTTQTVDVNYEMQPPLKRNSTILRITQTPSPAGDRTSFVLNLDQSSGPGVWDMLDSSSSLEILDEYDDFSDDEFERPRALPTTLPPIPSLPPPNVTTKAYNPRSPRTLEELEARGVRQVSNESLKSNDPLDPKSFDRHPSDQFQQGTRVAYILTDRKSSTGTVRSAGRTAQHKKTQSQAQLLPLHLNQTPRLTADRPIDSSKFETNPSSFDVVKVHWCLLVCFVAFPPLWLLLACGALDSVLHVPQADSDEKHRTQLTPVEAREVRRVRTIKRIAACLALGFSLLCLAGFAVGLALA